MVPNEGLGHRLEESALGSQEQGPGAGLACPGSSQVRGVFVGVRVEIRRLPRGGKKRGPSWQPRVWGPEVWVAAAEEECQCVWQTLAFERSLTEAEPCLLAAHLSDGPLRGPGDADPLAPQLHRGPWADAASSLADLGFIRAVLGRSR